MNRVSRAGEFLNSRGRDIDQARFQYHFGAGSRDALLQALGGFQNPDGGFGNALEPDIKAPDSNPFATELALLICAQADVPRDHPVLKRAVEYLENTQDEDGGWRFSPAVYQHELAPWFAGWTWPALNPSCTIAGYLRELGVGSERLHRRVEALFGRLARPEDLLGDYYAVRPYAYYFLPEWEHPQRELYLSGVLWWLIRRHAEEKAEDGAHFFDYVRGPETYTGERLPRHILSERLEMLEAEQVEDGGWPTPYDEHWRPFITVQNLLVLRRFGRV